MRIQTLGPREYYISLLLQKLAFSNGVLTKMDIISTLLSIIKEYLADREDIEKLEKLNEIQRKLAEIEPWIILLHYRLRYYEEEARIGNIISPTDDMKRYFEYVNVLKDIEARTIFLLNEAMGEAVPVTIMFPRGR